MSSERLKMIDLFSGAGGLSEGLSEAGFHSLFASEIVPVYAQTYKKNHPDTNVFTADIRTLDANEVRTTIALKAFGRSYNLYSGRLAVEKSKEEGGAIAVFGHGWGGELPLPKRQGRGSYYVDWILARLDETGELVEFTAILSWREYVRSARQTARTVECPGCFASRCSVQGSEPLATLARLAGDARKAIESQTGVPVITSKNAAQLHQVVTDLLEGATTSPKKQGKKR